MALLLVGGILFASTAHADRYSSTNFVIDASVVGNSIGGTQSSTSYTLSSSGGESVIGNGSGGSYLLGEGYVAQLQQSMHLTVQPNGLAAYWPFEENVGSAVYDETTNNSHGNNIGSPTWVNGMVGKAMDFDGSSQTVQVPLAASLKPTTAITLSAWIKPDNKLATTHQRIISTTEVGGYSMYFTQSGGSAVCPAGQFCFNVYIGGAYQYVDIPKTSFTNGVWAHVAATYDGSNMRIYLNGVLEETKAQTGTITHPSGSSPLCIGAEPTGASGGVCPDGTTPAYFDGAIDELKVYSRALSTEEIKAEYDAGVAGLPAGLGLVVTPGTSTTSSFDVVTQTDASGYTLAINQNQNLTSGGNTIPAISGSIASPLAWSEGSTKGLGFTMYGTNATAISGLWNAGSSYAALPGSATTFYTRSGAANGTKDMHNLRLRLDVNTNQANGVYTNQMTVTGTFTP